MSHGLYKCDILAHECVDTVSLLILDNGTCAESLATIDHIYAHVTVVDPPQVTGNLYGGFYIRHYALVQELYLFWLLVWSYTVHACVRVYQCPFIPCACSFLLAVGVELNPDRVWTWVGNYFGNTAASATVVRPAFL